MTHPSDERLLDAALRSGAPANLKVNGDDVREHLSRCPDCTARMQTLGGLLNKLAEAHTAFDHGHAAGKRRLMAALAASADHASPFLRRSSWKGFLVNRKTWFAGATAVCLAVAFGVLFPIVQSPSAFAQMTAKLRTVKSYRCTATSLPSSEGETCKFFWAAPGSVREETYEHAELIAAQVCPVGKPALNLDHRARTFYRMSGNCDVCPLLVLGDLGKYSGQADGKLPSRRIGDKQTEGFEVDVRKIDSNLPEAKLRVWIDAETRLPVEVALLMDAAGASIVTLRDFHWDEPSDAWLDTTPPAGFAELPEPGKEPSLEQLTQQIAASFKTYAKYSGGKYPAANAHFGPTTSNEVFEFAKLKSRVGRADPEESKLSVYQECDRVYEGFLQISQLRLRSVESAYNGGGVGPDDKNKVLFRWKLASGEHRVIFGDLHAETVSADRLKQLDKG